MLGHCYAPGAYTYAPGAYTRRAGILKLRARLVETCGMETTIKTTVRADRALILQGRGSEFDLSGILQMLEAQGATATFSLGRYQLDLYAGKVVRASGSPGDCPVEVVANIVAGIGVFEVRKISGPPTGDLRLSLTALLLESARAIDEARI